MTAEARLQPPAVTSGFGRYSENPDIRREPRWSIHRSQPQETLRVAVGDALFACGARRELIQEGARLRHRRVRVIGREHHPFHADLKHQIEERLDPVEAAESVVEVLAEVGADRALQLRHLYGQSHL